MKNSFAILLIICALLSFTTCQTLQDAFQEPVVKLDSVKLANINFTDVTLLCNVAVENKSPIDIPFPETGWEVFLNSNSFIKGVVKNNNKLGARKSTIVEIPVTLSYVDIFKTFASLKGLKETTYKVALAIKIPIPILGDKIWNMEHQGTLPVLQIPKISAPTMRVESRDISKAVIVASVNVENPNAFPIPSPKFSFDYQLNRTSIIKSEIENKDSITASSASTVDFRTTINYLDLGTKLAASLLTGSSLNSLLVVSADLKIPAFASEGYSREISGTLPLR